MHHEAGHHGRHQTTAVQNDPHLAITQHYLVADKIIDACKRTGAQAVHPGYGFLSENEEFAEALAANGITFIGPPASAFVPWVRSRKPRSDGQGRRAADPGYHGDDQTPDLLHKEADQIGYPVLIKAAAGGGGKGMRLVEKSADYDALASASARRFPASATTMC